MAVSVTTLWFICLFFTSVINYSGATPSVGGSGYGLYFDWERADVLSLALGSFDGPAFTVMYWAYFSDEHHTEMCVVNYGVYDSSDTPSYDSPDEFSVIHHSAYTHIFRGIGVHRCTTDYCVRDYNEWIHVAYTWRASDGFTAVYLNGDLAFTDTLATEANGIRPNGIFTVGQEPDGVASQYNEMQAFSGIVDEVIVLERMLSAQEVKDYADRPYPTDDPALLLYWNFDDPTATGMVQDLSSANRDGRLGYLDNLLNEVTYNSGRLPSAPTKPKYVVSSAPLAGHGPTVASLQAGLTSVEVPLTFATNDSKVPVDRSDPENPTSADGSTPMLSDYWTAYQDEAQTPATLKVETLPAYGILRDVVSGSVLAAGDEVNESRVSYEIDATLYSDTWQPLIEASGSVLAVPDVFTYSVDGVVGTAHVVVAETVETPADKEYNLDEDEVSPIILGGVDATGSLMDAVVKSLPTRGRLYQAEFYPDLDIRNIVTDPTNLTEIVSPDTLVTASAGIVLYIPNAEESSTGIFDHLTFAWRNSVGEESSPANLTITVTSVNDGPEALPVATNVDSSVGVYTELTLSSTDQDPTFSNGVNYFKIDEYPSVGSLYQVSVDDDSGSTALGTVLSDSVDITVIQYLHEFLNGSSQWSNCDPTCYLPWKCTCFSNTDFHWSQAVGPPDTYPNYGDAPTAGSFFNQDSPYTPGVSTFLEYGLAEPFYLTDMTVYETYKPGGIVKVSVSDEYYETQTEWSPVWEGQSDLSVLTSEDVRAWEVPLCPHLHPMQYVRFDFDLSLRPGWEEFDSVLVVGSMNPPAGYVQDTEGRVAYSPYEGVFSRDGAIYDEFVYSATDCVDFSAEPATVSLTVDPPTDNAAFATVEPVLDYAETTVVTISLAEAVSHALSIGVSEDEVAAVTARIVSYEDAGSLDIGTTAVLKQVSTAGVVTDELVVGERLDSGTGLVETVVADGVDSEVSFAVETTAEQGDVKLGVWVTLGNYVYSYAVTGHVSCPTGYWNRASDGVCVACRFLTEDDVAQAMESDEDAYLANCDLELCDAGTKTVWVDDAQFVCVDCEAGYYTPEAGMLECLPCENGTYSDSGMSLCFTCSPGYYSDEGASECLKCAAGYYAQYEASMECTPCPVGQYQSEEGQDKCIVCPPAHYSDQTAAVECTSCPPYTSNAQGVVLAELGQVTYSTIEECFPEKGWYGPPGVAPSSCPHGGVCCYCESQGEELLRMLERNANEPCTCMGGTKIPYPKPGYTRSVYDELTMIECSSVESCRGGDTVDSDGVCAQGYEDYRCGSCTSDYYMIGSQCKECNGGGAIASLLFVVIPLLVIGVIYIASLGLRLSSLHVLTDTLQLLALMYYLPIKWDEIMEDFFLICALANFNPQILQTECALRFTYFARSGFLLCLPFYWGGIWAVSYILVRFVAPKLRTLKEGKMTNFHYALFSNDVEFKNGVFVGGFVLVMILMHPLLFSKSIEPFVCVEQEDGYYYMLAAPEYRCYEDSEWKDNVAMFVVGLLVWGCGTPICVLYLLHRIRHRLFDYDTRVRYGVIYKGYKPGCYWWDIMALGRVSLFMVSIAVFSAVPAMQILMAAVLVIIHALVMIYVFPDRIRALNFASVIGEVTVLLVFMSGLVFDHAVASGSMSEDARGDATIAIVSWSAFVLVVLFGLVIWETNWTYKEVLHAGDEATSKECEMIFRDIFRAISKARHYVKKQQSILAAQGFEIDVHSVNNENTLRVQIVEKVAAATGAKSNSFHARKEERVARARHWSITKDMSSSKALSHHNHPPHGRTDAFDPEDGLSSTEHTPNKMSDSDDINIVLGDVGSAAETFQKSTSKLRFDNDDDVHSVSDDGSDEGNDVEGDTRAAMAARAMTVVPSKETTGHVASCVAQGERGAEPLPVMSVTTTTV